MSVDLKGALGCLPLYGDLYNNDMTSIVRLNKSDTVPIWAGEVKIEKEQEYHQYLNITNISDCFGTDLLLGNVTGAGNLTFSSSETSVAN